MRALKSYQSRPGYDCRHFSDQSEPCWGPIYGSSRGFECDGHRGGGYRTPEQAKKTAEETRRKMREAEAAEKRQEARRAAEAEAARWFRPHIERAKKTPPGASEKLSDPILKMAFSMIEAGWQTGGAPQEVNDALIELGIPIIGEVISRGLPWPEYPYHLKLEVRDKDLDLDTESMADLDLKLWYGCACWVMDFSCLNPGVRRTIAFLWEVTEKEAKRRTSGYLSFLCDMKADDLKEGWDD